MSSMPSLLSAQRGLCLRITRSARTVLLAGAAMGSLGAHAAYECNVKIGAVLVYADGSVNVRHSGRGEYTVVCNLNTERQGVSPLTCATWTAMLQHIKKNNGTANIYFNGEGACATLPTYWQAPAPVYIGNLE
jgi:hypothetical protein